MEICEFSSYTVLYLFSDYYLTLTHNLFYQEHNNITWEFHLKDLGPYPQGDLRPYHLHLKDLRLYPQGDKYFIGRMT
jgi:hypothetical protein